MRSHACPSTLVPGLNHVSDTFNGGDPAGRQHSRQRWVRSYDDNTTQSVPSRQIRHSFQFLIQGIQESGGRRRIQSCSKRTRPLRWKRATTCCRSAAQPAGFTSISTHKNECLTPPRRSQMWSDPVLGLLRQSRWQR